MAEGESVPPFVSAEEQACDQPPVRDPVRLIKASGMPAEVFIEELIRQGVLSPEARDAP